jgi:transcriptional regulator with XRE-family HTH domain
MQTNLGNNQTHKEKISRFGPLLKSGRQKKKLTLEQLGQAIGVSPSAISNFETGQRIPSVEQCFELSAQLDVDLLRLFQVRDWELANSAQFKRDDDGKLAELRTSVLEQLSELIDDSPSSRGKRVVHGDYLTLRDFPDGFDIHTIVVGDRREDPPNTVADILALTASAGDLMYLPRLGLQSARIRSDKIFKLAQHADLCQKLPQDILVVASGAANLASRIVNNFACFRFSVSPEVRRAEEEFESEANRFAFDPDELKAFTKRKHSLLTRLKEDFARPGFVDPIDFNGSRGFTRGRGSRTDYGVVTLCKNPWSPTGVAILAAGISGPGTAAALKLLATKGAFDQHPLGGVFSVNVATEAHWEDRYDMLKPVMDTHPYSVDKFEDDCRKLPADHKETLSKKEVDDLLEFLKLLRERGGKPRT